MKSYLNRSEKTQALTLASFVAYTTDKANEWQTIGRSKDAVKSLRMAKSFATRAMDTMFEGLDDMERIKIMAEVMKMEVVVKYRDEAIREYKRMQELDSVTPVETEELFDLCEIAMGRECGSCSEEPNSCRLRELLMKYDMPVANDSPEGGRCRYCLEEEQEERQ